MTLNNFDVEIGVELEPLFDFLRVTPSITDLTLKFKDRLFAYDDLDLPELILEKYRDIQPTTSCTGTTMQKRKIQYIRLSNNPTDAELEQHESVCEVRISDFQDIAQRSACS